MLLVLIFSYRFKAFEDTLLIEWNLLRDDEKEIKTCFEFANLHKQSGINPKFLIYNFFLNLTKKAVNTSSFIVQHLIKSQLKKVFNEEINIEDNFQRQFRNTRIKFLQEKRVLISFLF